MNVRLTAHLRTVKAKKEFKSLLWENKHLLDAIISILEKDYQSSLRNMYEVTDSSQLVGFVSEQKTLRKVINLLTLKVKNDSRE